MVVVVILFKAHICKTSPTASGASSSWIGLETRHCKKWSWSLSLVVVVIFFNAHICKTSWELAIGFSFCSFYFILFYKRHIFAKYHQLLLLLRHIMDFMKFNLNLWWWWFYTRGTMEKSWVNSWLILETSWCMKKQLNWITNNICPKTPILSPHRIALIWVLGSRKASVCDKPQRPTFYEYFRQLWPELS